MISDDWRYVKLGDLLNFRRGHDLPKKRMINGNIPVVGSTGIIGYHNGFTSKAPCLTIGRSGNIGKPHFINKDCWAHNTSLYVDNYKGNDSKYLYYLLTTLNLGNYGGGSAVPTLNRNHIHPIEVKATLKLQEQKAIAHVLSTLDEKIEVNNQLNKTLEDIAQTIFKRWFVDFEFPNEHGEPYQSSGGEMVDSELGLIPKGWLIGKFTDIVNVLSGGTPKTNIFEYWNGGIPFFTPKDTNGMYSFETEKYISKNGLIKCNSLLYKKNTVFITSRGTVGKVALAGIEMAMNQSCYALIGKVGINQYYVYFKTLELVNELKKNSTGSVFNSIVVNTFEAINSTLPNCEILNKFSELVESIFNYIHNVYKQNMNIKIIRDTLLPKLMSGEILVPTEDCK